MHPFLMPLGFLALGALFCGFAWLLLVEYRKAFIADPLAVISTEVLGQILRAGGPGYLAVVVLIAGGLLLLAGFALLLLVGWIAVQPLVQAILNSVGLR
jgi:hypothetical protein